MQMVALTGCPTAMSGFVLAATLPWTVYSAWYPRATHHLLEESGKVFVDTVVE
jgi:hypothetical protein